METYNDFFKNSTYRGEGAFKNQSYYLYKMSKVLNVCFLSTALMKGVFKRQPVPRDQVQQTQGATVQGNITLVTRKIVVCRSQVAIKQI